MKHHVLAAFCAIVVACTAAAGAAQPPAAIARIVKTVVGAEIPGSTAALAHLYTSDAVVVDEFPPFIWTGADSGRVWFVALDRVLANLKMHGLKVVAAPASEYLQTGNDAYEIVPLTLDGMEGAKASHETGTLTFTFRRSGSTWKISSQVWTTRTSSS